MHRYMDPWIHASALPREGGVGIVGVVRAVDSVHASYTIGIVHTFGNPVNFGNIWTQRDRYGDRYRGKQRDRDRDRCRD